MPTAGSSTETEGEARRAAIRAWRAGRSRRTLILDDDPTGSQAVHDVEVVLTLDPHDIAHALRPPGAAFVLTNTRGMTETDAVAITRGVVTAAIAVDPDIDIVSRSDSTLRGHVLAEVAALTPAPDLVVFAPAFFEAGRFTSGGIHYATLGGEAIPVGETEFARDATFGYRSSDVAAFLEERSGGALRRDRVIGISLDDIAGGPAAVRNILMSAAPGSWIVPDATGYEHYEILVLELQAAIDAGRRVVFRTGPSFVRALLGTEPRQPLDAAAIRELTGSRSADTGHGLVVVGSHVGQTSRQVAAAQRGGGFVEHVLSVPRILTGEAGYLDASITAIRAALAQSDVLLYTSRDVVTGADAADSLAIARRVSAAVAVAVAGSRCARPSWVVAKGGITSHEVAVDGLGIRRARVAGQLLPGMISVFEPIVAPDELIGVPYVVFAGNVGDDDTLAHVVTVLRSAGRAAGVDGS